MISGISNSLRQASAAGLFMVSLAACSTAAQAATYTMYRDPGCGCCLKWAEHVREGMNAKVEAKDSLNMQALKDEKGVPNELRSCHTMMVDGYVIEGHVPADAIAKLLREKPAGVTGIAVAGMPVGSPGMEYEDMKQPFQVMAFGPKGKWVYASYN